MSTSFHPATEEEVVNLAAFDGSFEEIEGVIGNPTDIAGNWSQLGVEPEGARQRVVLIERSSSGIAFIVGDGVHFGRARVPTEAEVAEVVARFGLRGSPV